MIANDFTFKECLNQPQPPKMSSLSQKFDPNIYSKIKKHIVNTIHPMSKNGNVDGEGEEVERTGKLFISRAPLRYGTPIEGVTDGTTEGTGVTGKDSTVNYEPQ